jgi:cell division protein FtsI/penicillin-binding protein 2
VNHDNYKFLAERQQKGTEEILALRGMILDRNNDILAYTKDDVSFYLDKRMLKKGQKEKIAERLAEVFNKKKSYFISKIDHGKRNIKLISKAPKDKAETVGFMAVDGFFEMEDYTRIYPYGSLASHVLGYLGPEKKGLSGLEKEYEEELCGANGLKYIEKDVLGRLISVEEEVSENSTPGKNITLTIDKNIQRILETELLNGLKNFEGKSAAGIVMNPQTGEILAMSNLPDYDPANYFLFPDSARRNRCLADIYEPGSTIKSIVMSMLIEENLVNEYEVINTENGVYKVRGAVIRDVHKYEKLTVREILEHSSNVGIAKLSDRIDKNVFYKYLRDFGFGNKTFIDLPGEVGGILIKPEKYSKISKKFIAHGYEISVTPLQMATAFCALVNGGRLYKPYLIKEIKGADKRVYEGGPQFIRNVISEETSEKIKDFMVGIVEQGTAKLAKIENVLIGGKTGTSQKIVDGEYSSHHHNASFIGFFPADNPQFLVYVLVDSPQKQKHGGRVAAPIFREIAKKIIEKDFQLMPKQNENNNEPESFDIMFASLNTSFNNKLQTNNYTNTINKKKAGDRINRFTMPNLKNYSTREAISILSQIGLKYKIAGGGKVYEQSIEPGTKINPGDIVYLKCSLSKNSTDVKLN